MPTRKDLEAMSEDQYCAELEKTVKHLKKFFNKNNEGDMPFCLVLPHKYGIAVSRQMTSSTVKDAAVDPTTTVISYPMTNLVATILEIVRADQQFTGYKAVSQMFNDQVAYEVLVCLLAELLVGDRIDDNLGLHKCLGMREAMAAVEKLHGMVSDEDGEEDEEEEFCSCEQCDPPSYKEVAEGAGTLEACVKTEGGGIRGYRLDVSKITPTEFDEFCTLMKEGAEKNTAEATDAIEKFMREHGAECVPTKECEKQIAKILISKHKCVKVEDKNEDEE